MNHDSRGRALSATRVSGKVPVPEDSIYLARGSAGGRPLHCRRFTGKAQPARGPADPTSGHNADAPAPGPVPLQMPPLVPQGDGGRLSTLRNFCPSAGSGTEAVVSHCSAWIAGSNGVHSVTSPIALAPSTW